MILIMLALFVHTGCINPSSIQATSQWTNLLLYNNKGEEKYG